MKIAKLYLAAWLVALIAGFGTYAGKSFNSVSLMLFAFITSALFFFGIFGVFPELVSELNSRSQHKE